MTRIYFTFFQLWYRLSKTLAEEAAWKFAKEKGLDMIAINPGFVIGPLLQTALVSTPAMFLNLIEGMLLQILSINIGGIF